MIPRIISDFARLCTDPVPIHMREHQESLWLTCRRARQLCVSMCLPGCILHSESYWQCCCPLLAFRLTRGLTRSSAARGIQFATRLRPSLQHAAKALLEKGSPGLANLIGPLQHLGRSPTPDDLPNASGAPGCYAICDSPCYPTVKQADCCKASSTVLDL